MSHNERKTKMQYWPSANISPSFFARYDSILSDSRKVCYITLISQVIQYLYQNWSNIAYKLHWVFSCFFAEAIFCVDLWAVVLFSSSRKRNDDSEISTVAKIAWEWWEKMSRSVIKIKKGQLLRQSVETCEETKHPILLNGDEKLFRKYNLTNSYKSQIENIHAANMKVNMYHYHHYHYYHQSNG